MAAASPKDMSEDYQELQWVETKGQCTPDTHKAGALPRNHGWNLCIYSDDVSGTWMVPREGWPEKGSNPNWQSGKNEGQWQWYGTTNTACTRVSRKESQ